MNFAPVKINCLDHHLKNQDVNPVHLRDLNPSDPLKFFSSVDLHTLEKSCGKEYSNSYICLETQKALGLAEPDGKIWRAPWIREGDHRDDGEVGGVGQKEFLIPF